MDGVSAALRLETVSNVLRESTSDARSTGDLYSVRNTACSGAGSSSGTTCSRSPARSDDGTGSAPRFPRTPGLGSSVRLGNQLLLRGNDANHSSTQHRVGGADDGFPVARKSIRIPPFNARVEFAIVGNDGATAGVVNATRATVFSGSDILQQQGPITDKTQVTAQSKSAVYPDDFLLDDVAAAGERLSVQLDIPADTTFDAIFDTVVKITPL